METPKVKSRGRPRKRRREDSLNEESPGVVRGGVGDKSVGVRNGDGQADVLSVGSSRRRGRPPKVRAMEMTGDVMVGRYVLKEFDGSGVFLGKIVSYDSGLYRVDYEDGDCEDLDSGELREFVIKDDPQRFLGKLLERRKKLDEAIGKRSGVKLKMEPENEVKLKDEAGEGVDFKDEPAKAVAVELACLLEKVDATMSSDRMSERDVVNELKDWSVIEVPTLSGKRNEDVTGSDIDGNDDADKDRDYCLEDDDDDDDDDGDEDSSIDCCEYGQGWDIRADTEIPAIPPPQLPPSSGTIGVPEEYVSQLFSVHGFLRTFSVHLFLSPFTLDDLVGCLKCTAPNTLLDAVHVVLLRALRRQLERLASEESEHASKCLRSIDWDLLDILTWPVYLVHYLMAMGHLSGPEWNGFCTDVLQKDYYTLSVGIKLSVLQILCDDALDTEEVRSEIDTREESEVGFGSDGISSNSFEKGPREIYPRYAKTFVDKDTDNPNPVGQNSVLISSKTVKSDDHNRYADNVGEDSNGDECRLCGMEGMLVCCDGCPSAYHTRCIGVNKLSIPDGKWFCPECTISRIGPLITGGTSLKGAEVFGVDSYAQLFLGTCNHLLVLTVSFKASSFVRYYNHNDVPKVLSVLSSSPYHSVTYLGICQAISKYWELPQVAVSPAIVDQASTILDSKDDYRLLPFRSLPSDENRNDAVFYNLGNETYASRNGESLVYCVPEFGNDKLFPKSISNDVSFGTPMQNDPRSIPYTSLACERQNATNVPTKLFEQAKFSRVTQEALADQLTMAGIASCNRGYVSSILPGQSNGVCLPESHFLQVKEDKARTVGRTSEKKKDTCLYMGSVFKPFAYINNYVHGAFAASAAANFSSLSADENQASEVHASDARKAMAANVLLQVKAFSSAAVRFFWPSTEKKLTEIPRERCSWCFHCKSPVTYRKGCLLNQAAVNATRGEMRFVSGLRLEKIVEGGLYGIAAYILYMEESFRGLILGPFRSSGYREQWRKKVEQVSTCSEIKSLLLDLERNLFPMALSSEWTSFVDTWMDVSSVPQSAAVSAQKRSAGRRKKHLSTPEVTDDDPSDPNELNWWRGGKLAKLLFQRGTFPRQVLRKALRQGGSRMLPGVYYADGSDVPRRSRQFIWRAGVEMAKNASQLALQVRYLDQHIKWSDLIRPEQTPVDGKGPETEAFAFRNAQICDKKIMEDKIIYGVAFGHHKHLSSRLMKSIIEKEENEDGTVKYWLLEARIPLYLLKEYEEKAQNPDSSPPVAVRPRRYSKHQRRQLKASRKDIFVYLALKRDDLHLCPCASCHKDLFLELAVTCNSCEGYCHNNCMLSPTDPTYEGIEFRATCKQCSHLKFLFQSNINVESPTSPLVMQGKDFQNSTAVSKSGKQASDSKLKKSKSSKSKERSSLHRGLKWKKKGPDADDGSEFRLKNIICTGSSDVTLSPECYLCNKRYNPNLMYIRCDSCENWYHAVAVELDESKLSDLVGYKCCRCRRMKSPPCPFADPVPKPIEVKKLRIKGPKNPTVESNSVSESLPSTPLSLIETDDDVFLEMDDPVLLPVSQVEQIPDMQSEVDIEWNNFGQVPQKLQIRKHIKSEDDGFTWNDFSSSQLPVSTENNNFPNPNVEWDPSNGGLEDGTTLNNDNLDFECDYEPQTYFSFTELLETDGDSQLEGVDASREVWDDFPCEYSQNGFFMDQCDVNSVGELEPKASTAPVVDVKCEVCQIAVPLPNLACQICGIHIHSHCTPRDDGFQGGFWICGQCRGLS